MTQRDIEEVLCFAKQRGMSVLEIGVSPEVLAEYNKATLRNSCAIRVGATDAATLPQGSPGGVRIVAVAP